MVPYIKMLVQYTVRTETMKGDTTYSTLKGTADGNEVGQYGGSLIVFLRKLFLVYAIINFKIR